MVKANVAGEPENLAAPILNEIVMEAAGAIAVIGQTQDSCDLQGCLSLLNMLCTAMRRIGYLADLERGRIGASQWTGNSDEWMLPYRKASREAE